MNLIFYNCDIRNTAIFYSVIVPVLLLSFQSIFAPKTSATVRAENIVRLLTIRAGTSIVTAMPFFCTVYYLLWQVLPSLCRALILLSALTLPLNHRDQCLKYRAKRNENTLVLYYRWLIKRG